MEALFICNIVMACFLIFKGNDSSLDVVQRNTEYYYIQCEFEALG